MNQILVIGSLASVLVLVVAVGGYQLGTRENKALIEDLQKNQAQSTPVSFEEALENDLRKMEAQIESINADLTKLDEDSQVISESLASIESPDDSALLELQAQIDALPQTPDQQAVPLPPESSSAKALALPRTESGIPRSVLENYQNETGISPEQVEELMKRTQ